MERIVLRKQARARAAQPDGPNSGELPNRIITQSRTVVVVASTFKAFNFFLRLIHRNIDREAQTGYRASGGSSPGRFSISSLGRSYWRLETVKRVTMAKPPTLSMLQATHALAAKLETGGTSADLEAERAAALLEIEGLRIELIASRSALDQVGATDLHQAESTLLKTKGGVGKMSLRLKTASAATEQSLNT